MAWSIRWRGGAIAAWLAERTIDEALDVLNAADVPVGRIYSAADMFTDPQFAARKMIEHFKWQDGLDIALPNVTPKLSETPGAVRTPSPDLGQHNDEVYLALLQLDRARYDDLRARKVI